MTADLATAARQALSCLDLTSLNDSDDQASIARLCARAHGVHGAVAAVCVWPRLAAFARRELPAHTRVAAVANFPSGDIGVAAAVADAQRIVQAGAQELDLVLPWRALLANEPRQCSAVLAAVRRASEGLTLKVILETGALGATERITQAAHIALAEGADFLKTSTGKLATGATPAAARTMLQAIAADPHARGRVGFKAAGGVRTVPDAAIYLGLVAELLGADAVTPARCRIGASGLLDDIEAVLSGQGNAPRAQESY